jgi:WhiB family transcriptional regulator, redox-sensing transcriptional regulator
VTVGLLLPGPEVDEEPLSWRGEAACRGNTAAWFSTNKIAITAAKAVCQGCPVRVECLSAALAQPGHDDFGVWGGTTAKERRGMRRRLRSR